MNKKKRKIIISIFTLIIMSLILIPNIKTKADNINSWYTFNENQPLQNEGTLTKTNYVISASTAFPITFNPTGEYEVTSNTIKAIIIETYSISYYMVYYDRDNYTYSDFEVVVFYNGEWNENEYRYIFINGIIEDDLSEYLENNGIWALTYVAPPSDLSNLIWSVADIIPNTIKSMTSFEIFGFTLFAIIGSFCLIILLIKMVKGIFL